MTTGSPLLDAALKGLLAPLPGLLFACVVFFGPVLAIGWVANKRKARYKAEADEPFTDQPLRPPGESLRLRIEELSGRFDEMLLTILFTGVVACFITLLAPPSLTAPLGVAAAGTAAIIYIRTAKDLFTLQRNLWNHRLGFAGERVVGESLNQLLADGYHVFHDLPFDGFNIDHVIVGPSGVYAVETKTRRKPADMKGPGKARVVFDGNSLEFPASRDTRGLEQALRNADTLSQWLTKSTGESTPVSPMLVLPGWYVVRKAAGSVKVLNEKEIAFSFPSPRVPLPPDRIQRIVHQLTERCRITKPDTR